MRKNGLFIGLAFILPLALYLYSLAPSLFWEDSTAFQLTAAELGIPHNPSFPIYLLLAKLFTLIPLGSAALMVNLASAFFSALAVMMLYLLAVALVKRITPESRLVQPLSLLAALVYAVTYGVWLQSVRAEVYALNAFLTLLLIWLVVKYHYGEIDSLRFACLTGLIGGLGLANHYLLLGAVIAPVLLATIIYHHRFLLTVRMIGAMMLFCLIGLSAYLYLPIRESFSPLLSWGDFSSLEASLKSILRLDEQLPLAVGAVTSPYLARLISNLNHILSSTSSLLLIFSFVGVAGLLLRNRLVLLVAGLPLAASLATTAYAAEFSIYNLDLFGYLMPVFAMLPLLALLGASYLREGIARLKDTERISVRRVTDVVLYGIFVAVLLLQYAGSSADASKAGFEATDRYVDEVFAFLPPHAIFLAGEDNSFQPLLYRQGVDHYRTDVVVLSGGALLRSDYRRQVKARYPGLWYPHDWKERGFAAGFIPNLKEWVRCNAKTRPVYLTLSKWTTNSIHDLRPAGFVYSFSPEISLSERLLAEADDYYQDHTWLWEQSWDITTREHFARLLYNYAVYCLKNNQPGRAAAYCQVAAVTDPNNVDLLINCYKLFAALGLTEEKRLVAEGILELNPNPQQLRLLTRDRLRWALKGAANE
ncbi:MAG: DUF2723 domain-containing protein [candidate division Zixibacteria bacterium]|nr:DUF2723 domain-containing protein [candidate division Zixibacteria bacterium]